MLGLSLPVLEANPSPTFPSPFSSVPVIDFFCKLLRNFTSREDIM